MSSARPVLGLGILLVAIGFASVVYYDQVFDTWVRTDVAPPPGSAYAGDMTEAVFYQDEARVHRARSGRRTGFALLGVGVVVGASALVALRRAKSASDPFRAP
jgi:hypothetical protein